MNAVARDCWDGWRSTDHPQSLLARAYEERLESGTDYTTIVERLIVRDATFAICVAADLFFGNHVLAVGDGA